MAVVERLAALERPPGSAGAHTAADELARELTDRGVQAHVEAERVHGTYWVPIGPENLHTESIAGAARLAEALVRRLDRDPSAA
jgi:hypothetical protein